MIPKPRRCNTESRPYDVIINGAELTQGYTGVSVYLKNLVESLKAGNSNLTWAVALPASHQHLHFDIPSENVIWIPGRNAKGYLINEALWQFRTAVYIRKYFPQSVFHAAFHFWSPVLPYKTLITAHDCIEFREPSVRQPGRVRRIHRSLCWQSVRRAMRVLAVSQWTRDDLVKFVGADANRVSVIYNWINVSHFYRRSESEIEKVRRRYRLPDKYVAYVGGFRSYKNVDLLLGSWARLPKATKVGLALAGQIPNDANKGFYCDVLNVMKRDARLEGRVSLPGPIANEDLPAFYSGAELFVSPSRFEGFGYPPVEASACETPILVADSSAYQELFPSRVRCDVGDVAQFDFRLREALTNPAACRCSLDNRFTPSFGLAAYTELIRAFVPR